MDGLPACSHLQSQLFCPVINIAMSMQQFQTLSCAFYTIIPVLNLDLVIQALLLDYILALAKNTNTPCMHLVFIEKSIFLNIFKTKYTTKSTSVS